jgi:hypothetical protein
LEKSQTTQKSSTITGISPKKTPTNLYDREYQDFGNDELLHPDETLQIVLRKSLATGTITTIHRPPQLLLPETPNYDWDDTDNLILRYKYDFMPKGISGLASS